MHLLPRSFAPRGQQDEPPVNHHVRGVPDAVTRLPKSVAAEARELRAAAIQEGADETHQTVEKVLQ
jgi:hypothetical protein